MGAERDIITAIAESHRSMALVHRLDLWHLVKVAFAHGEISMGKASELLGLPLRECMRILPAQEAP